MRYQLTLISPTGGTSGSLSVTKWESDYYGSLYLTAVKSSAAGTASGYIYAGKDARDHAINKNTGAAAATITIPDGTSAVRTQASNVGGKGPNLGNVWLTCCADGTFTDALTAYTDAPNYEVLRRMVETLGQNYAAASEPLRDHWRIVDADIERGLTDRMTPGSYPRFGVAQVFGDADLLEATGSNQITHPTYQWTVWIADYSTPQAAHDAASQLLGFLYSVAFDEQRNWGGLALNTFPTGRPAMKPINDGERYGYMVMMQLRVDTRLGTTTTGSNYDSVSSTHGGRYASVTVKV